MIYQFLDWRLGVGRVMFYFDVEHCLNRLRAVNGGKLPLYLDTWDCITAFAGEAKIALPELEEVARELTCSSVAYPSISWVCDEYTKFLLHIANGENSDVLKDPEPVPEVVPLKFAALMEQSTSNTAATGEPCSEPLPATVSHIGTPAALPNSLSMGVRQYPLVLRKSTPTLVPKHLSEQLKEK